MNTISVWPILIATLVAFGIGSLWYSPILFGKEWMRLVKLSDSDIEAARAKGVWKSYLVGILFSFISFCILAFISAASSIGTAGEGAFLGLLLWLGFVVPMNMSSLLWTKQSVRLLMIDSLNFLICLAIGGAIIGAW